MRTRGKWLALGVVIGSLALCPGTAGAAPIDGASDHTAWIAEHSYLQGLLASTPAIHTAVDDYVSSVASQCRGVLAPLKSLPQARSTRVRWSRSARSSVVIW